MTFDRARSEQGYALVTAMIVLGLMLSMGLAIFAYSDGQTRQTHTERIRESSFNLAERALEQQTFKLSRSWAGSDATAYPAICAPTTALPVCPDSTQLISGGDAPDATADTTWTTIVRDNGDTDPATDNTGENFYSAALVDGRASWDANGDGVLWVKATAQVRDRTRSLVAKVRVESITLPFPKTSITANTLYLSNNGNNTIIDTNGPNNGDVGPVQLRCGAVDPTNCIFGPGGGSSGYDVNSDPRISPPAIETAPSGEIVEIETRAGLLETALANNTVYDSCPTDAQLTGQVVYIRTVPASGCAYEINGSINSATSPGIIVVAQSLGRFQLRGNLHFYGLMYFMNGGAPVADDKLVLDLDGTIAFHGSVAIEGDGALRAGSSGNGGQGDANVTFDQSLFGQLKTYGTAGILQNSWREIRE